MRRVSGFQFRAQSHGGERGRFPFDRAEFICDVTRTSRSYVLSFSFSLLFFFFLSTAYAVGESRSLLDRFAIERRRCENAELSELDGCAGQSKYINVTVVRALITEREQLRLRLRGRRRGRRRGGYRPFLLHATNYLIGHTWPWPRILLALLSHSVIRTGAISTSEITNEIGRLLIFNKILLFESAMSNCPFESTLSRNSPVRLIFGASNRVR